MRERNSQPATADELAEITRQMEERVNEMPEDDKELPVEIFIPSGCSVVNLALSDRINGGGWPGGRISQITGPSDLGKSAFGTTALANAAQMTVFDHYRLQDWDIEHGRTTGTMFGSRYKARVEHWHEGGVFPVPSTVEEAHMLILDLFKKKTPFIINLDSLDFLPSRQALKETEESFKNWTDCKKDETGSYNMAKQKYLKKMLGEISRIIGRTQSSILVVGQIVANAESTGKWAPKTTSTGGYGIKFGSRIRVELHATGETDKVAGEVIGREVTFRVIKNHITFKRRNVNYWIYEGLGLDDIRSSVEFLIKKKYWIVNSSGRVTAKEFPSGLYNSKGEEKLFTVRELVKNIDSNHNKNKLDCILQRVWNKTESEISETIWEGRTSPYI